MPEPLHSWLSKEEFEALKAQLLSLISNDMSIDSCMQVCSTGTPLVPTKVGFEAAVKCLKLLSKASLLQFKDKTLQMGLKECLSMLRSSNRFPHSLIDELNSNVYSVLMQQIILAATLQSQENLLAE